MAIRALIVPVALAAGFGVLRVDRALQVAAALTAHDACAAAFIQGVDPDETVRELVRPMTHMAGPGLRYRVDASEKAAEGWLVGGFFEARAVWTEGYGCRVIWDPSHRSPEPVTPRGASAPDDFAPQGVVETSDPALRAALDQVFAEHSEGPPKYVKAAVVVKDGRVVAERYAPGFGVATPLLSYSVAKSFTNAILAVLVKEGRLRVEQPVGAPEWSAPGDPRAAITVGDLLSMQSGLDAEETGSGFDPASQMLFLEDDMAGFAASYPAKEAPRTRYEYTSADTLILDRLLGETVGGGAEGMRTFADRELFAPLRMDGVTLEFDGAGVFVGSAHVYAPARSYARFGMLYVNDGMAPDGRRILPEGWVDYSRRSTLGSGYGAGFYTNDGPSRGAARRVAAGFPKDGFFASGNRGQRIYVVPSERLVVARFGYSGADDFGIRDDLALIKAAIETPRGGVSHDRTPSPPP